MSIGPWEIVIIIAVLLVLFGASRLPAIGKSLGEGIKEFRKVKDEIKSPVDEIRYPQSVNPQNIQKNNDNSNAANKLDMISFIKDRTDLSDKQKNDMINDILKN